jgi:hypothetical protein
MKSSTILSFFIPVLATALPQGPGSYNAPSGYNAPKPGYNATPAPAAGGLGGLVGGLTGSLPLVGGLLGGASSDGAWSPCAGTTGSAQCCATDVLGVADLDCLTRTFAIVAIDVSMKAHCVQRPGLHTPDGSLMKFARPRVRGHGAALFLS